MTKPFFLLGTLLTLSFAYLSGQPTLTRSTHQPVIGDIEVRQYYDSAGVSPGPAGQGVTWDFTNLTPDYLAIITHEVVPAGNQHVNDGDIRHVHPVPFLTNNIYFYHYYTRTPWFTYEEGYTLDPAPIDGEQHEYFTSPFPIHRYPFNYGDTYTGNHYGQWVSGWLSGNSNGTDTLHYDGYGTLKLPSGTYHNIMRIHQHRVEANNDVDAWYWYADSARYPLFVLNRNRFKGVYTASDSLVLVSQEVPEVAQWEVGPNPLTKGNALYVTAPQSTKATLILYTVTGQVALRTAREWQKGRNTLRIDQELTDGVYFLRIETQNEEFTHKIMLQR